jgi:hypothetical protein
MESVDGAAIFVVEMGNKKKGTGSHVGDMER